MMNDEQVEKILKELRDIRGVMNKAYQLFGLQVYCYFSF